MQAIEPIARLIERDGVERLGAHLVFVLVDRDGQPVRILTAQDLDYADRIRVAYEAEPEMKSAVDAHIDWIKGETLAVEVMGAVGGTAGEPAIRIERV